MFTYPNCLYAAMESKDIKKYLLELFPKLDEDRAELLAKTGDDINVLITRVLDDNVDPPTVEVKSFCRVDSRIRDGGLLCHTESYYNNKHNVYYSSNLDFQQPIGPVALSIDVHGSYNYPEVFERACNIDMHVDVEYLRKEAAALNRQASMLHEEMYQHQCKQERYSFGALAHEKKEKARELNIRAAIVLMRRIVEGNGAVDLHGLTASEAYGFIDDFYRFKSFERIRVITGQAYNSTKIRPAMERWFERNGFRCYDDGPCIVGVKTPKY